MTTAMEHNLDTMSAADLRHLPDEVLLDYFNHLADLVGRPRVKDLGTAHTAARRISTLRGVRIARGMDRNTPATLVVTLCEEPAPRLKVGRRDPRGVAPRFHRLPGDEVTRPSGGLRLRALELLEVGATPEELEALVLETGGPSRMSPRYRALELLRVLNYRNGWGFFQCKDTGLIYATDRDLDVINSEMA